MPHNMRRRTERLLASANIEATWGKPPSVDDIMKRDRERILADPVFSEPLSEFEQAFAGEILALHSPEQIAAAFLRQTLAERTAPEELLDAAPAPERKRRDDFKDGVWFSLSVGHDQNAEPRWLLPMLCRGGHITKNDIGAIRIQSRESFVELKPGCVEMFLESVGPSLKLEKTISVTRVDGLPEITKDTRDAPKWKKKSYEPHKPGGKGKSKANRKFTKERPDRDERKKPWEKTAKKSKGKKPFKGKDTKGSGYDKDTKGSGYDKDTKGARYDKDTKGSGYDKAAKGARYDKDTKGSGENKAAKGAGKNKFAKAGGGTGAAQDPGSTPRMRKKPQK